MATSTASKMMKFITWNIDGINPDGLQERTTRVCQILQRERPDILFFQEIIPLSLSIIGRAFPAYVCIPANNENYFTTTLLLKETISNIEHQVIDFPNSKMERNMLVVKALVNGKPFVLINCHLESLAKSSAERKNQLKTVFDYVVQQEEFQTVVFAGDLNLRDEELSQIGGIPSSIEDIWITCGSREEYRYTWDLMNNDNLEMPGKVQPRKRFDRVYLRQSNAKQITVKDFGFIGQERISSCDLFPSDHWGLVVDFKLEANSAS